MFKLDYGRTGSSDGVSRRNLFGLSGFGLTLADMLRVRAAQGAAVRARSTQKVAIMIYLPGGPNHMDMYDLKPEAPAEFRGEFKPIDTRFNNHDYSRVRGNVAAPMSITATMSSAMSASTATASSAECHDAATSDGGDGGSSEGGGGQSGGGGGGGGSAGEDGGDGDGEPPITPGLAFGGDDQEKKSRPVWTLLKLLWGLVPSIRNVWYCLKFTFPHSIRQKVIRVELLSLMRARRLARGKRWPFRAFVWAALRWRTALLVLRCVRESLKEAGVDVQLDLRL